MYVYHIAEQVNAHRTILQVKKFPEPCPKKYCTRTIQVYICQNNATTIQDYSWKNTATGHKESYI
jgi:hypothetical protein